MKNKFLYYFLITIVSFSCKKGDSEITELNSFLDANYEFNNRILNRYKGDYYLRIEEQPSRKIEELNQLDSKFELLISDIDNAISSKENNLDKIISKSDEILDEIPKIVDERDDYLLPKFEKIKNTSHRLKFLKNKLVIAMAYAFEYGSRKRVSIMTLRKIEIDNIVSRHTKNGTSLTLSSKYGQNIKENRRILINKIEYNGQKKELNYELKENYSIADIELDSLKKGTYIVNGILRFYERDGKFDIPFNKKVEVE